MEFIFSNVAMLENLALFSVTRRVFLIFEMGGSMHALARFCVLTCCICKHNFFLKRVWRYFFSYCTAIKSSQAKDKTFFIYYDNFIIFTFIFTCMNTTMVKYWAEIAAVGRHNSTLPLERVPATLCWLPLLFCTYALLLYAKRF